MTSLGCDSSLPRSVHCEKSFKYHRSYIRSWPYPFHWTAVDAHNHTPRFGKLDPVMAMGLSLQIGSIQPSPTRLWNPQSKQLLPNGFQPSHGSQRQSAVLLSAQGWKVVVSILSSKSSAAVQSFHSSAKTKDCILSQRSLASRLRVQNLLPVFCRHV